MAPRDKTACQTFLCKCKICISSIECDVYNKKKIQMFGVNMTFISSREVKKMYISFVPSALMKYTSFHFTRWNKSHIHSKHLNILYIWTPVIMNYCYHKLKTRPVARQDSSPELALVNQIKKKWGPKIFDVKFNMKILSLWPWPWHDLWW